jgi:hypothetical protein
VSQKRCTSYDIRRKLTLVHANKRLAGYCNSVLSLQLNRSGSDGNVKRQRIHRFERYAADRQNMRIKKVSASYDNV